MDGWLFLCMLISFSISTLLIMWWIKKAREANILGKNMHHATKKLTPEMGGLPVVLSIIIGLLCYIAYRTFIVGSIASNVPIMATITTLLLLLLIGITDDLLGWKIGLKQYQKPLLCAVAALPLVVLNAGVSTIYLPLFGNLDLGILYPLIIIPVGIAIASNGCNMLAGLNGLEASLSFLVLGALGWVAWIVQGNGLVAMIAAISMSAIAAFLLFNWFPAAIFPGNSFTYPIGGLFAIIAILANIETVAIALFTLFIIEAIIKLSKKFKSECFCILNSDHTLAVPKSGFGSLTHSTIYILQKLNIAPKEPNIVLTLMVAQGFLCVLVIGWYLL